MSFSTALDNEMLMPLADNTTAAICPRAEISDNELVALVRAGHDAAFESLFERYKRLVASIGGRYFRRPEQVEEIIQISFAKIYFELRNFRGDHDFSLASWIGRISTNACLDTLRAQKRRPENLHCELSPAETESLKLCASDVNSEKSHADRDLAEKLLSRLEPKDRAILQMLHAEEMSTAEISELTGWSGAKIKIRAFRARRHLRTILRKYL
jgi:RNA polymerase sigma-70 factor, ECF subfamily